MIEFANPIILDLFAALKARVEAFYHPSNQLGGSYMPNKDLILINVNGISSLDELNMVLLHELVHWSGAVNRLDRESIRVTTPGYMEDFNHESDHFAVIRETEEATAQIGMFLLARELRLPNLEFYFAMTHSYLSGLPLADIREGEANAAKALQFIFESIQDVREAA